MLSQKKPGAPFAVKTDIHHPADVSLLWDAMRCPGTSAASGPSQRVRQHDLRVGSRTFVRRLEEACAFKTVTVATRLPRPRGTCLYGSGARRDGEEQMIVPVW